MLTSQVASESGELCKSRLGIMDLYIGVPLFTKNEIDLRERLEACHSWFPSNKEEIAKKYHFSNVNIVTLRPGKEITFRAQDTRSRHEITVTYPEIVPKGLAVRLHMMTNLNWIDGKDYSHRNDSYYVLIDGSGAFDFENIYKVLDKLLARDARYDVVLGKRPQGDPGIPLSRKNVELFEEYLLRMKYSEIELCQDSFPDGQAGCWGLCFGSIKSIPLTAMSYELEYDLLASSIQNALRVGFSEDLLMNPRTTSDFGHDDQLARNCLQKMDFIVHKLDYEKANIHGLLKDYVEELGDDSNKDLPDWYIDAIEKYTLPSDY